MPGRLIFDTTEGSSDLYITCSLSTSITIDFVNINNNGSVNVYRDNVLIAEGTLSRVILDFANYHEYHFEISGSSYSRVRADLKCNYGAGTIGAYILQSSLNLQYYKNTD